MSSERNAQASRKAASLSDRLEQLDEDAGATGSAAEQDHSSAGALPPPIPDSKPAAKSSRVQTPAAPSPATPTPASSLPATPIASTAAAGAAQTGDKPPPIPGVGPGIGPKVGPGVDPGVGKPSAAEAKPKSGPPPPPPVDRTKSDAAAPKTARNADNGPAGDVPDAIRPNGKARRAPGPGAAINEARPQDQRRAAQRRPAGPSRDRIAANDDAPSIGGLIYALNQRPSNRTFSYAAAASGLWAAIALGFSWAFMSNDLTAADGIGAVLSHPSFLTAFATVVGPILLFWFIAVLLWRAEELHLRSTAMTEVAVRLAEPDRMAEQSVASLGQAVRRQVSFMNDAVTRALGRAGELEALVHREVSSLENSYEDNERKIRGLIQELSGERHALLNTGDQFKDTLVQLGSEVPQLIDQLNQQQLRLAQIIEHAGTNLNQLESAIGSQTDKLQSSLGQNTDRLQRVLEDYTGALAVALGSRTDEMQTVLTGYTEALGGALDSRTQQMQSLLEDKRKAIDSSLETASDTLLNRTETIQLVFEEYGRALDETLANRTEAFDMQLVERTKALDNAFGERLRLFDEAMMRSTLAIDSAVGDNATALTSALDQHAENFTSALAQQAVQLDETLVRGIDAVRASSENISRQSIKAIEGLASQSDLLRNVSENLLDQISSVSNRFESQGQAIMRSANALESANYRIDRMLADRSDNLSATLERMSGTAEQLGAAFDGYSKNLEGTISGAQEQAKLLTQDLSRETAEHARAAVDTLQQFKQAAAREADQALEDLRSEFSSVSREVTERLGTLSDQFSQTTGQVREHAARAARELENEQGRLKQQLDQLPSASQEHAAAMRKALQDQLKALDQLAELAQNTAVQAAARPPSNDMLVRLEEVPARSPAAPDRRLPLASLSNTLARELHERQSRQVQAFATTPQAAPAQQPAAMASASVRRTPGPNDSAAPSTSNWSVGDLLARVSEDDGAAPEPAAANPSANLHEPSAPAQPREPTREPPPAERGAGIDIAQLARALDSATAAAIWSRFRNGQRGFMVRSIYAPEARHMFDEIVHRYQTQPEFRSNADIFVREFERTLRDCDQRDPSGDLTQEQIVSDTGRVYLLFAHASQRLV